MGTHTSTEEFTSPVPAAKLFQALFLDSDNLLPKILPQVIKSIETIEGDGGPGSIKKMNFAKGSQLNYLKHRIDAVDTEKMTYSYTLIEGDTLKDKFESVSDEIKFEATPDGGCKGTKVSKYLAKPGVEIDEEEIKAEKAEAMGVYKAIEAYLLASPDA